MTIKMFNELVNEFVYNVNEIFLTDYSRSETDHFFDINCNETFVTKEVLSYLSPLLKKIMSIDVDINCHVVLSFAKDDLT